MYSTLVEHSLRRSMAEIERGQTQGFLRRVAPDFEHTFYGEHALGGTRRTRGGVEAWFARLFRLFPGIRFELERVVVRGWPWRCSAMVQWREHSGGPDGSLLLRNQGVHVIELCGPQIVRFRTYTDTALLKANLGEVADLGYPEALADPIVDASTSTEMSARPGSALESPSERVSGRGGK